MYRTMLCQPALWRRQRIFSRRAAAAAAAAAALLWCTQCRLTKSNSPLSLFPPLSPSPPPFPSPLPSFPLPPSPLGNPPPPSFSADRPFETSRLVAVLNVR